MHIPGTGPGQAAPAGSRRPSSAEFERGDSPSGAWAAPTCAYGEFEGLRLPTSGAAVWTLPDGTEHAYIEVELTDVEYDPPLPA